MLESRHRRAGERDSAASEQESSPVHGSSSHDPIQADASDVPTDRIDFHQPAASLRLAQGGKFCRRGMICREPGAARVGEAFVLSRFFRWHTACSTERGISGPQDCGISRSFVMILAAASTALNLLEALTTKKSSAAPSTGLTQTSTTAFDPTSATTANSSSSTASSSGSSPSGCLSPSTMSALLDAQGQSSSASAT